MDIIDKFFFVGLTATLLAFLSVCTFVCYDVFHGRIKYPVEYIVIIIIGLLWVSILFLSTVIGTTNISEKVGVYYDKEFGTLIGIFSFWLMNIMIRYYKYVFLILPYKKSNDRKYDGEMDNFLYVSSYNWGRDTMVVLANSCTCN